MVKKTVAQFIVETLAQARVKRIYGVGGDSLVGLTEALRNELDVEWIQVRHEETAAFAAGAEAHLTESLAVCAGSSGAGSAHLLNGLYDCHKSRVPVLALVGQIPRRELGSDFQEAQPEKIFSECSQWCETVVSVEQMPRCLEMALQTALTKKDVSVLVLPSDVAQEEIPGEVRAHVPALNSHMAFRPSEEDLQEMTALLDQSKKVTLLAGAGCAHAHTELIQLADLLKAPIVHTLRGKEFIEFNNPYDVGMTGWLGFSSGYQAMLECDTLLMLGTDFPYRQFYPKSAKIIQLDQRGENIGRRAPVDHGYVCDIKTTLLALLDRLENKQDRTHLERMLKHYQQAREEVQTLPSTKNNGMTLIHPQQLTRLVSQAADEDAIFTCDSAPLLWAARFLKMNGYRRLIGSFNHGSEASALGQALGAQMTSPERQVIALCGDIGFSMAMGEILSLRQRRLPVKVIIYNPHLSSATPTDDLNPSFADLAASIGLHGVRIENPESLEEQLAEALGRRGPVIIDVRVSSLGPRFSEFVDPTKTNWFHRNEPRRSFL
jgi:pyruvate dehydrogenase (quinone)